ncbi:MAG TPA: hypothetical protein VH817_13490 [Thermoleophilaceae bacterium]
MRAHVALLTLGCLAVIGPAQAHAASPNYELVGSWSFHGDKYRFTTKHGAVSGQSLTSVRIGHCVVRKGSTVFSGYRYSATHGGSDYWKGKVAAVGRKHCKRRLVSSTIKVESDLKFTESSRLPGGRRAPPSTFNRIRPPLSASDPVIGTWLRNGAGVIVKREGRLYIGRAREAFGIANGCTVPAGAIVWRMRPLAPGRYSGTIQTFFGPPGCKPAALDPTSWRFSNGHSMLVRESSQGQSFPYKRA